MASDIEIQAREIIKMNERLIKIFSKATGQSEEKIARDIDRDYWLSADDAVGYGLVSRVVTSQSEI
jgi:ATP-dependent Clp protease protease subunit